MTDYRGNSHAKRKPGPSGETIDVTPAGKPEVKKVVAGEVKVRKRGLGRKIKDTIIAADFGSVVQHVTFEVIIPAAKNMLFDGAMTAVGRALYGNDSRNIGRPVMFGGGGVTSKIAYQTPVQRTIKEIGGRMAPLPPIGPRARYIYDEVILTTRKDAESVLDMMNEILDNYEVVTIFELNELCGRQTSPVDSNYGWVGLVGAQIRQIPEGYLLELPQPEPIHR